MTKYDDVDYHAGDALAKGQPEENAFTHIGTMLSWLIRHGLTRPKYFGPDIDREVKDGSLLPNDLRDFVDGQLVSDLLKPAGSAFLDAYYTSGYLADYQDEFAELSDYSVPDDPEHQLRIDRRIDDAYERWLAAGRPKPSTPDALWSRQDLKEGVRGDLPSDLY